MSKLKNFDGSVQIASGMIPKNNNDFPLMEAHSIQVDEDGTRLDELLGGLGDGAGCEHNYVKLHELSKDPSNCTTWQDICYCTKCEVVKARRLHKTHPWNDAICTEEQVCTVCGTKGRPPHSHYPGEVLFRGEGEFIVYYQKCTECGTEIITASLLDIKYTEDGVSVGASVRTIPGDVIIPDKWFGRDVVEIRGNGFLACEAMTNVKVPDSVNRIGFAAFKGCNGLKSITIPFIGEQKNSQFRQNHFGYIFGDANNSKQSEYVPPSLTEVTITGGNEICANAFEGCDKIKKITLPDGVTDINGGAFRDCSSLTSITIPDSVTFIGFAAFYNCDSLTSVVIPDSVTMILSWAFKDCSSLTSITIPDSIGISISGEAFIGTAYYNNENNWKDGVLYIGNHLIKAKDTISGNYIVRDGTLHIAEAAFYKCTNLTSIVIPDSVTYIEDSVFSGCSSLASITVEEGNEYYYVDDNGNLIERNGEKVIFSMSGVISSTTSSIGSSAFYGNTYFAPIKIPSNITTIEANAFGGVEGGMTVYVEEHLSPPEGWADDWCDETVTVIWGYTDKDTCEHVWGDWEIDRKPTCTQMGKSTSTCTICGKISSRKIAPFGHVESDWIIDIEPTTDTEGSKHKVCLTCGETTQVESIPRLDTIIYILTEDGRFLTDEQGNKLIIEGD